MLGPGCEAKKPLTAGVCLSLRGWCMYMQAVQWQQLGRSADPLKDLASLLRRRMPSSPPALAGAVGDWSQRNLALSRLQASASGTPHVHPLAMGWLKATSGGMGLRRATDYVCQSETDGPYRWCGVTPWWLTPS